MEEGKVTQNKLPTDDFNEKMRLATNMYLSQLPIIENVNVEERGRIIRSIFENNGLNGNTLSERDFRIVMSLQDTPRRMLKRNEGKNNS